MTEQQVTNWLSEEAKKFTEKQQYEELPSLKLQPNVIAEITVDFSSPFQEWKTEQNGKQITKKIVPVTVSGTKMVWWLNIANPIYSEIVKEGLKGQTTFKVLQTGTQANTKYVLVK